MASNGSAWWLAQYNIAWMVAPLDEPVMADFKANIDRVNLLAEKAPGFRWRHKDDNGDLTGTRIRDDDRILINFSAWGSADSLFQYAFYSGHAEVYRRRLEWFTHDDEPFAVLWWVPEHQPPTVEDAEERLAILKERGPSPEAFTFKQRFARRGTRRGCRPPRASRPGRACAGCRRTRGQPSRPVRP